MNHNRYATIECRQGFISDEFIAKLTMNHFGLTPKELEMLVGRVTRGKRKGQLKGRLNWLKCVRGGWRKIGPGYMNGQVVYPNTTFEYQIKESWTDKILMNEYMIDKSTKKD